MSKFCHLHTHNEYSLLDGVGTAKAYATEAAKRNFSHLALTNHGNVDGAIKHQTACDEQGIVAIQGCEAYIVPDHTDKTKKEKGERRAHHITLLVKNATGWTNLLRLLSKANLDGFYYTSRIDPALLLDHSEGLIVLSGCTSCCAREEWGRKLMLDLREKMGDDFYLEVMPHCLDDQREVHTWVKSFYKEFKQPIVATNDSHYPEADQAKLQEVLMAVSSGARWNDKGRWKLDINDLYLKTEDEMNVAFTKQANLPPKIFAAALRQTMEVAEKCEGFKIEKMEVNLPRVPGTEGEDEAVMLKRLIKEGFQRRIIKPEVNAKPMEVYRERLTEEAGLISNLGFQRYFLIVWELIDWCKKNDIMTGPGRGSVGGSLVAYCLGITDVDPLRYDLLFARFISPARIDLPDIDMDFEDRKRGLIRQHLEELYGRWSVSGVSTFGTLKGRSAVRDVGRVFEVPYADIDSAAKSIVVRSGGDFRSDFSIVDAFETFEDGIRFKKKHPEVSRIAIAVEGQVRNTGQHAAGMCVSTDDLRTGERTHYCLRKGVPVCNWSKEDAEYMGLMKLDVLGLSALSVLSQARLFIKENHGIEIVWDDIPLDDEDSLAEVNAGHTIGAFQIGSAGLSGYCKKLGIDSFDMIVAATSLWRPGTLRSGMTETFVERKQSGKKNWDSIHPIFEEITKETYGIILYQEQIMRMTYELAGLPWRTCDVIRKVISKSQGDELFKKHQAGFVAGCAERGTLDEKTAISVWKSLASFGSYGFNKSHAVEYSLITFWDMFLKTHYPCEFMAASLTYGSRDKSGEYIDEARRLGLTIELPKVGRSNPKAWIPRGMTLYAPFDCIKGVGEKTAEAMLHLGGKDFNSSFYDPPEAEGETNPRKPNKSVMAVLDQIHAWDLEWKPKEEDLDALAHLFPFDLSRDPMRKVRSIFDRITEATTISTVGEVLAVPKAKDVTLLGKMDEIRFGYKKNVLKANHSEGGKGGAKKGGGGESLGGVYGFFSDTFENLYLVFESEVYGRKKDEIEAAASSGDTQWMMVRGSRKRGDNLFCEEVALESDLFSANIGAFRLSLVKGSKRPSTAQADKEASYIRACTVCPLNTQCKAPVPHVHGNRNVFIIGETPGKIGDEKGVPLAGRESSLLWKALGRSGLSPKDFHLTNVVKCLPSATKALTIAQTKRCGDQWLRREIKTYKPIVALAFGNTALKYFRGMESGIMRENGTTVWDRVHGLWVCYCLHPSSVFYSDGAAKDFQAGIDNFVTTLKRLGLNQEASNSTEHTTPNKRRESKWTKSHTRS